MTAFIPPANVTECDARMVDLRERIAQIDAQLRDPARTARLSHYDYRAWRVRAMRARAAMITERGELKIWKARWDDARKAAAAEAARKRNEARLEAARIEQETRHARRDALAEAAPDPAAALIILRLHNALWRRRAELDPADALALTKAREWLIAAGIFGEAR